MNRVYCATSGEVVEWPKALVLKTRDGKLSVGSNPTLSANYFYSDPNHFRPQSFFSIILLRPQLFIISTPIIFDVVCVERIYFTSSNVLILPEPTLVASDKRPSLFHSLGCSRLRLNPTLSVAYRQVSQRRKELNLTLSGRC
jgi:hypothetical protein